MQKYNSNNYYIENFYKLRIIIRTKRFFRIRVFEVFKHIFSKKDKKTLVYLGIFPGSSFSIIIHCYETCYGFEGNPDLYKALKN